MSYQVYRLQLKNGICQQLDGDDFIKSHYQSKPAASVIYVMRKGKTIFYVGQAGRGLYRCLDGLTAKSNQSIAYTWRADEDLRNSKIEVLVAYGFLPPSLAGMRSKRELVEADVTAAIFVESGSWPYKLKQLTVRGDVSRTRRYKNALRCVLKDLKSESWL